MTFTILLRLLWFIIRRGMPNSVIVGADLTPTLKVKPHSFIWNNSMRPDSSK
jgi:hypothetical protein